MIRQVALFIIAFVLVTAKPQLSSAAEREFEVFACHRVTDVIRQFCKILSDEIEARLELPYIVKLGSTTFDIASVLQDGRLGALQLDGLIPYLKFSLEWSDSPTCWQSELRYDKLALVIRDTRLGYLRSGFGDYAFRLTPTIGAEMFQTEKSSDTITITTKLRTRDERREVSNAIDTRRYPVECKITMSNLRLEFDGVAVSRNIDQLRSRFDNLQQLILKSAALHFALVHQAKGATCLIARVYYLAQELERKIDNDNDEALSSAAKRVLTGAVASAVDAHAIRPSDLPIIATSVGEVPDYWAYFVREKQNILNSCEDGRHFKVSSDPFTRGNEVLNEGGVRNARDHARYIGEFWETMVALCALGSASLKSAEGAQDIQWVLDGSIYGEL